MVSSLIFVSCETANQNASKQNTGALIGAAGGALLGSQFGKGKGKLIAVGLGTLLGAAIGGDIGRSMDEVDRLKMQQTAGIAFEKAPDNQSVAWENPNNGHKGSTVPTKTYYTNAGTPCREFQNTVIIGGNRETAYGIACRQSDGSWKIKQ
tara:strand:- start:1420 stop:1872 length:453 start_codon:yes stop_codon:yes gene_type:complete